MTRPSLPYASLFLKLPFLFRLAHQEAWTRAQVLAHGGTGDAFWDAQQLILAQVRPLYCLFL